MLMVYDLNREQLDELKTSYFWQDETQEWKLDDLKELIHELRIAMED